MTLPAGVGLDELLFLERHEARVHATPRRDLRDLGHALLLYDRDDREPFWNRIGAVRWPAEPAAFEARLADALALFAILDRIPHIWPRPALNEPPDIVERLLASGWDDTGGGYLLLLTDPEPVEEEVARPRPDDVTVERLHDLAGAEAEAAAADFARVLAESFEVDAARQAAIEAETREVMHRPEIDATLLRVRGEPAAAVKRTTFDGASYLSSIGTRPAFRGRGLGRLATAVASADALRAGSRWTYLGVFADNVPAYRLYRALGYEPLGDPAPDLLLR